MRQLRPYQVEAIDAVRAEWDSGVTRTAVVHATGLGKSSIIGRLAVDEAHAGGRTLVLAHRGELLDQITDACRAFDPTVPLGRVQAARNETRRAVTLAMAPTLANAARRDRMPKPTLVIADEAHHAASKSWMSILGWAGSFDHVRTLGVTATLVRGDKRRLGDVWQSVAHERGIEWAVEHGWLVRPHGRVVVADHVDLENAKISKGDYQDGQLGEMVTQDVEQIVNAWRKHAADRITVAFTPTTESAGALQDEFVRQGIAAGVVTGTTSPMERNRIYTDLAAGRVRVVTGVMVMTEGWDCPPVSCILMARPTKRPGLYQQIIGRGLRPHPESGKKDCLVFDVVGASKYQQLTTLIDLLPGAERDTEELDALPCPKCGGFTVRQLETVLDDDSELCTCEPEPTERDPDGGRRKLLGPVEYEDHDLFAASRCTWLFTRAGVRFLPAGDRIVALWPDGDDPDDEETTYSVGHGPSSPRDRSGGEWLSEGLALDEARLLGETWALGRDASLSTKDASWRKPGRPSEAQVRFAANLRIADPETMTKARLSDEISIALASRVLDRHR